MSRGGNSGSVYSSSAVESQALRPSPPANATRYRLCWIALRHYFRVCMESNAVQGAILFVVVLDFGFSILRVVELDLEIPTAFDIVVLIVLTADILCRIAAEGSSFFCDRRRRFINMFELLVVAACWFDFLYDVDTHSSTFRLLGRSLRLVRPLTLFCQQRKRLRRKAERTINAKAFQIAARMIGDILNIQKRNLGCNLIRGRMELNDAEICSETFRELYLPITLVGGFVKRMLLCSPVLDNSRERQVRVEIKDVLLLFGPTDFDSMLDIPSLMHSKHKLAELVARKLDLFATTIQSNVVARYRERFQKRMLKQLMSEAKIEINNVTLRYEDSRGRFEPFTCGLKLTYLSLEQGSIRDCSVRSSISGVTLGDSAAYAGSCVDFAPTDSAFKSLFSKRGSKTSVKSEKPQLNTQKLRIHRVQAFWDMHPATRYSELLQNGLPVFPKTFLGARPLGQSLYGLFMSSHFRECCKLALATHGFPSKEAMWTLQKRFPENWKRVHGSCTPSAHQNNDESVSPMDPTLRERFDHHSYMLLPVTMKVNITWRKKARTGELPSHVEAHISPIHLVIDSQQSKSFNCLVTRIKEWFLEEHVRCTRPLKAIWKARSDADHYDDFFRDGCIRCGSQPSITSIISAENQSNHIRHWWKYLVRFKQEREAVEIESREMALEDVELEYKDVVRQWWKHAVRALQTRLHIKPDTFSQALKEEVLADAQREYVKILIESRFRNRFSPEHNERNIKRVRELQAHMPVDIMLCLIRVARDHTRKLRASCQETLIEDVEAVNEEALQVKLTDSTHLSQIATKLRASVTGRPLDQEEDLEKSMDSMDFIRDSVQVEDTLDEEVGWSHEVNVFLNVESLQVSILIHSLWGWLAVSVAKPGATMDLPLRGSGFLKSRSRSDSGSSGGRKSGRKSRQSFFHIPSIPSWRHTLDAPKPGGFGFERFRARVARRMVFVQALAVGIRGNAHFPGDFFKRNPEKVATGDMRCRYISVTNQMAPEALREVCHVEQLQHEGEELALVIQFSGQHDPIMMMAKAESDWCEEDSCASPSLASKSPTTRKNMGGVNTTVTKDSRRSTGSTFSVRRSASRKLTSKMTATKIKLSIRSNRSNTRNPCDGETWKDALKEKCWVCILRIAPIRIIHYRLMIERLMIMARQGRISSLAQEEFKNASGFRFREKLKRLMFYKYLFRSRENVKQRILLRCVSQGMQMETIQRFSRYKVCVMSSALPPVRSDFLWAQEQATQPFCASHVEETNPSAEETQEFLQSPFGTINEVASTLRSFATEDFGFAGETREHCPPPLPVLPRGSLCQIWASETVEVSGASHIDPATNRIADSCWCWPERAGCSSRLRANPSVMQTHVAEQSSGDVEEQSDTGHGRGAKLSLSMPRERGRQCAKFSPSFELPKPSCATAVPAASFSSATEGKIWQVLPWQFSIRLVDASSLNLMVGNAATRADDFAAVATRQRLVEKSMSGRFSYLGMAEKVKQTLCLNLEATTSRSLRGFQFAITPEANRIRTLFHRNGNDRESLFEREEADSDPNADIVESQIFGHSSVQDNDFDIAFQPAPQSELCP